jgi:aspartate-semialdehyde dehydrogenase
MWNNVIVFEANCTVLEFVLALWKITQNCRRVNKMIVAHLDSLEHRLSCFQEA